MSLSKVSKLKTTHKVNTKSTTSKHSTHQLDSLTKSVVNFLDEHQQLIKNHLKQSSSHDSPVQQLAKLIVHLITNERLLKEKIKNSNDTLYAILQNAIAKVKKPTSGSKTTKAKASKTTKKKTVAKKKVTTSKAKTTKAKIKAKVATVKKKIATAKAKVTKTKIKAKVATAKKKITAAKNKTVSAKKKSPLVSKKSSSKLKSLHSNKSKLHKTA
ncbi:hypothetical protein NOVO_03420 [Rickettsiales bacterium Ac37b]|nr:hypothetical protein NOVO_03420 [Rickettsiales bacterium Ac37b]